MTAIGATVDGGCPIPPDRLQALAAYLKTLK